MMIEIKPNTANEDIDQWLKDGRFQFISGFYAVEWDQDTPFIWTGRTFVLKNHQSTGPIYFIANYLNEIGELTAINSRTMECKTIIVKNGWYEYLIEFTDLAKGDLIEFKLNHTTKVPNDGRELGLRIKRLSYHDESYFRTTEAPSPTMLTVETSTICNLSCVMCAHAPSSALAELLPRHNMRTR